MNKNEVTDQKLSEALNYILFAQYELDKLLETDSMNPDEKFDKMTSILSNLKENLYDRPQE